LAAVQPTSVDVLKELGYLEMRLGHNASAARWLRQAIDVKPGPQENQENVAAVSNQSREALQQDLARLTNRFDMTIYEGYSDHQQLSTTLAPGLGAGNVVPAGGGFELAYQPPGIGFHNERVFQMFARGMWNNQPSSFAFQSKSGQMGLGVRYKPLISQNLQLSFERLIPVGADIQPNWMLRAMTSWNAGFSLKPSQRMWNYSLLFLDAASLLRGPRIAAQFGQARQGITFRAGQQLLVTPHLVATARRQSPQAAIGTYLEAGAGLSLRFLPHESMYSRRLASSFEVLTDCHKGVLLAQPGARGYEGCRAAGILRF
jgi:bacteriophage N4 adsorption protein A